MLPALAMPILFTFCCLSSTQQIRNRTSRHLCEFRGCFWTCYVVQPPSLLEGTCFSVSNLAGEGWRLRYSGPAGYDRLDIRPTWVTTKSRVTTRASASVASTYPTSRAVHCERSRCLLCFAGTTMLIPLIKVCTV
jgi:hypothetical protein